MSDCCDTRNIVAGRITATWESVVFFEKLFFKFLSFVVMKERSTSLSAQTKYIRARKVKCSISS